MIMAGDVPESVVAWQQRVCAVLAEIGQISETPQWSLLSSAHNAGVWRLQIGKQTWAVKYTGGDEGAARLAGEAAGLRALANTKTIRVPAVIACGDDYLISEWLPAVAAVDQTETNTGAWQAAGQALAALHEVPQSRCGFAVTTHCGPTAQDNRATMVANDALAWFGERRLVAMAVHGAQREIWPASIVDQVEDLALKMNDLCPAQQPSLCHGDLWSGNAQLSCDEDGALAVGFYDPAVACGPAEADVAMAALFGGFPEEFYRSYEERRTTLVAGWRQRLPIYQLYHVLHHWLLFGGSYGDLAQQILVRYGCEEMGT